MPARRLNRLIDTATAADHSQHGFVHETLRCQELERRVNIGRHFVPRRGKIRVLSVLAASKTAKVQRESVVTGRA